MSNRILKHLRQDYSKINDFIEIDYTQSTELDALDIEIEKLENNQYVETSDMTFIKRREKMLGIQANSSTETLEFRKKRILNRYRTKPPFTIRYLQEQLDFLIGQGKATSEVDIQNFILSLFVDVENAQFYKEVESLIKMITPANMVYQPKTLITNNISLRENILKRDFTANYLLGSWRLGEKPFATLGQEVVVK